MDLPERNGNGILWRKCQYENCTDYEGKYPLAFGWTHEKRMGRPRYRKGEDGFWYCPADNRSGKAIICCTGDLMCEPRQHHAYQYGDDYFFHPGFYYVRDVLCASDLCMGNLETTLSDQTPYAGEHHRVGGKYHCNAPACYLEAIRYGGFDVLVNANNHNCDSGAEGLYDTLESLDRYGFMHTGTFRSPREERFLLICVNGIRMAVLSYATYFNRLEGNFTEKGRQEMLNLYSREKAAADIAQARNKGAEFILVYIHWGKEYTHEPNEEQRQLAEELAESGADYIVGSHTHCLQRRDTVTARDGRTIPVVYSMGNFITGERKEISKHTGILQLTLQKHGGKIVVTNEAFIPCYVFEQIGSSRLAPVPTEYLLNKGVVSKKLEDARRYIEPIMRLPIVQTAAVSGEELCGLLGQTAAVDSEQDEPLYGARLCGDASLVREGSIYFDFGSSAENIAMAWEKGAVAVITENPRGFDGCIRVPDVRAAYESVCSALWRRFSAKSILVTGRFGIQKVAAVAEAILSGSYLLPPIAEEETEAVDFSLLRPSHERLIQEADWDIYPLEELLHSIKPTVCVVSDFVSCADCNHKAGLVKRLSELADGLERGGTLLLNGDDPAMTAAAREVARKDIHLRYYGIHSDSLDYRLTSIRNNREGLSMDMAWRGGIVRLQCPMLPEEQVYHILAATALALCAGVLPERLQAGLSLCCFERIKPLLFSYHGLTVLADSDCESAHSLLSSFRFFHRSASGKEGRRTAVLGDVRDFEPGSAPWQEMLQEICCSRLDDIIYFGKYRTEFERDTAEKEGAMRIACFNEREELEERLIDILQPGGALMIAGGTETEFHTVLRRLFGVTDGRI